MARRRPPDGPPDADKTTRWDESRAKKLVPAPMAREVPEKPDDANVLAWLSCDPLPPVPIGPKPVILLGRSRDCDMILPHESVSRTHAAIRALGKEILLEDRSTYGTTVNGKRVVSKTLVPDDVITMGPYLITVRPRRDTRDYGEALTKPFRVQAQSSEAMGGRLEKVSLAEVLQSIEFNKKTGTLKVFNDAEGTHGTLVVYEGSPMYAEIGDLKDTDAVINMLGLPTGNFSFVSKVEAGEKTMEGTLTAILFEAGRQADEASAQQ